MKKTVLLLLLSLLVSTSLAYASSSTSYTVTAGGISSGGGSGSSTNYSSLGTTGYYRPGGPTSSSYIVKEGFFSAAFVPILGPMITAINPNSAYNNSPVHITQISGANFSANPTVKLSRSGENDILATNVVLTGATQIACDFDLAGAAAGFWDVVITSALQTTTLPNAFEVKAYTYSSSLVLNSPNPFDPARETTALMYQLPEDKNVTIYIYNTSGTLLLKKFCPAGSEGGKLGQNSVAWNGLSEFSEMATNGMYIVRVIDHSGKTLAKGNIAVMRR